MSRIADIKTHLRENKKTYLVGAGTLVLGVVATLAFSNREEDETIRTSIKQFNIASSPVNVITTTLERRGHPGNLIRCIETGEVFASQNRAAEVMHLNQGNLSKHLSGTQASVGGYTFENLGEAR